METSIYLIVETDRLEVSFTPANTSVIDILIKSLCNPRTDDCDSTESFVLVNDLAVRSIVMLYQKTEVNYYLEYSAITFNYLHMNLEYLPIDNY